MQIDIQFVGRADALAAQYEGMGRVSFIVQDLAPTNGSALLVPAPGDLVALRMHPGPDTREFRCVERLWDFSEAAAPLLRIRVDMP